MQRVRSNRGFTLIEMGVVLAVVLIITVAALPSINRTLQGIRLRSSAESIGGMLQKARMQAVKDNRFYTLVLQQVPNGQQQEVCVDLNFNGACNQGEPVASLAQNVTVTGVGAPATTLIYCGPATPVNCPPGYTGYNFTPEPMTVAPSYNARGLPCVGNPATPPPVWPTRCFQIDPNTANPVGFLYTLRYLNPRGNSYGAVSVTPAGLVTVWMYSGVDQNGNAVWSQ